MHNGPEFQTILESLEGQNLSDQSWSELVFGTTPQCSQAKLCICVQGRLFEDALPGMEELTNERVVEPRLPLLDEGKFKTPIVSTFSVYWDGSPNIQVVMLLPVAQSQLSLHKSLIGELKEGICVSDCTPCQGCDA